MNRHLGAVGEPEGEPPVGASSGGTGGTNFDERLRNVELDVRAVKTDMKHVATKAWVLAGVIGGMGTAAGIAALMIRAFS
ncbi:MAG: hypothetical protein OXG37_07475 [Actinomycetia bacterium]|nr:hypothetical protein [Actinomycetes bacterium]